MAPIDRVPSLPDTPAGLENYYADAPDGIRANMVMTVDGAGAFAGRTKAISSDADQTLLGYLRRHADAVMIGSTTVQAEKYGPVKLTAEVQQARRDAGHLALPPLVIVTAHATVPKDLKVFNGEGARPVIATVHAAADAAQRLSDVADIVFAGETSIDPTRLVEVLHERGLSRILCEGGPFLLGSLIEADLIDDMCLTLSPFFAGSQPTTALPKSAREMPAQLRLRHVLTHEDLLYLRYSRDAH